MATIGKNDRQPDPSAGERPRPRGSGNGDRTKRPHERASFERFIQIARDLPRRTREGVRDRPGATLAAVAGASFVLGVLLSSRLVRAVLVGALPYAISRVMQGEVGEKALRYASELRENIATN